MSEIALRQIRAIIAVCEEGSFTRTAARENATQSGISQHVAAAERTLGVKLFERTAAGVMVKLHVVIKAGTGATCPALTIGDHVAC